MDAVDAATVSHIVVDAHRQRAGTLGHQSNVAPQFRKATAARFEDIVTIEGDLSGHTQTFYTVVETVECAKQRAFAATGGTDDASDLVAGDLHVDVFQYVCPVNVDVEVAGLKTCARGVSKLIGHGKGSVLSVEAAESKRKESVAEVVECTCYCVHKRLCFTIAKLRKTSAPENTTLIVFSYHNDGRFKYPHRAIACFVDSFYLCTEINKQSAMRNKLCKEKSIQGVLYIIRSRMVKLAIVLLLLPMLFSGCGRKPAARRGDLQGNIAVSGAFALYPLMLRWADAFSQRHPGVTIDVSAGGSGKGITDVLAGQVDLGMVSRELKAPERQRGAVAVAVARDAVVPIINIHHPLYRQLLRRGLTQQMACGIWVSGRVKTWGQVAGMNDHTPVNVYTRSDACGAAETFAAWLKSHQEDLLGTGVYGDPGIVRQVANDPYGLGMCNISYAFDDQTGRPNDGIALFPIDTNDDGHISKDEQFYDSKQTLIKAIQDGRYPCPPARELYVVSKGRPQNAIVKAFLRFILEEGQQYNVPAGFIPVNEKNKAKC